MSLRPLPQSRGPTKSRIAAGAPATGATEPHSWLEARLSGKGGVVRSARDPEGMSARLIGVDRDQVFLMPPSVRDWVPEDHLVWTVLDTVGGLDLSSFYAAYRVDGYGRLEFP